MLHQNQRPQNRLSEEKEPSAGIEQEKGDVECDDCNGSVITDNKTGEQYCEDCGLVIKSIVVDQGPEWTSGEYENNSRTGSKVTQLRHDQGMGSVISYNGRDGYGKPISNRKKASISRRRVLDSQAKSGSRKEHTLRKGLSEIQRMGSALGIPEIVQEIAAVIFRKTHKQDLLIGRSIEGISSASIYAACRIESVSRSVDEVGKVSRVGGTEIKNCYLFINKTLQLEVPPANPTEYTGRMGSKLDLEQEYTSEANRLIELCRDHDFVIGRKPTSTAAGVLYAVLLKHSVEYNQERLAKKLGTNGNTIRTVAKYILNIDPDLESLDYDFENMRIDKAKQILESESF